MTETLFGQESPWPHCRYDYVPEGFEHDPITPSQVYHVSITLT